MSTAQAVSFIDVERVWALQGGVEKWDGITNHGARDGGPSDCTLCQVYRCHACPVVRAEGVNNRGCYDTPHEVWIRHHDLVHEHEYWQFVHDDCSECKQLARAELDFLRDLLAQHITPELAKWAPVYSRLRRLFARPGAGAQFVVDKSTSERWEFVSGRLQFTVHAATDNSIILMPDEELVKYIHRCRDSAHRHTVDRWHVET